MSHIEVRLRRYGLPAAVVIVLDHEEDAIDVAHAFPVSDGFHRDLMKAVAEAWPDDEEDRS